MGRIVNSVRDEITQNKQIQQYQQASLIVVTIDMVEKTQRCERLVRGFVIKEQQLPLSPRIAKGSVYCAANGLDPA